MSVILTIDPMLKYKFPDNLIFTRANIGKDLSYSFSCTNDIAEKILEFCNVAGIFIEMKQHFGVTTRSVFRCESGPISPNDAIMIRRFCVDCGIIGE